MKYTKSIIQRNPPRYHGDAVACMVEYLDKTRRGRWENLTFEHVDLSGYWFSYTDTVNDCRSVWCIRFSDVSAHCNAVHN